jgi:hypothetical protein
MDIEQIGLALVKVAMISRCLGHADMTCTARDYLLPHKEHTPEMLFVLHALTGRQPLTEQKAIELLQLADMPAVAA